MKKLVSRLVSLTLSLLLCGSLLAACGGGNSSTPPAGNGGESEPAAGDTTAANNGEETIVTIWNVDVSTQGIQNNPIADAIAEKTGVRIEVVGGDSQKFKVLMAGGDLPDIIIGDFNATGVDNNTLLASGQLMALDDLVAGRENFLAKSPKLFDYSREFMSQDGKLYFIPVHIFRNDPENPVIDFTGANLGMFTRYDLYREVGSPDIADLDEYLEVLRQMQDAYPETEDGKKTYAISGFSDWGMWMYTIAFPIGEGYTTWNYDVFYNYVDRYAESAYYSDTFWKGIEFYNKAYNLGILDPEMFTQKYENYIDKVRDGQVFVAYANWMYEDANRTFVTDGTPEKGFELVPNGQTVLYNTIRGDTPFGWGMSQPLAVTTNCKNPEKVMDLLDFCFSEEGSRLLQSGIEGIHWEYDENGAARVTDEYYAQLNSDPNYREKQGLNYNKLMGLDGAQMCSDGYPVDLTATDEEKAKKSFEIDQIYAADLGYEDIGYAGQIIVRRLEAGEYIAPTEFDLTTALVEEPSEEVQRIVATVDDYMSVALAQVIMASREDFETEKQKVIDEINAKGYEKVAEEMLEIYERAGERAASYEYD